MRKSQTGFALVLALVLLGLVVATSVYIGYVVFHKSVTSNSLGRPKSTGPAVNPPSLTLKPVSPTIAPNSSPSSVHATGTITGHVFSRCSSDPRSGCQSQTGVAGVTISLHASGGTVIMVTVTDKDGRYSLTAPAGTYTVTDSFYNGSFEQTIMADQTNVVNIGG